jgi:hypothetical protein
MTAKLWSLKPRDRFIWNRQCSESDIASNIRTGTVVTFLHMEGFHSVCLLEDGDLGSRRVYPASNIEVEVCDS